MAWLTGWASRKVVTVTKNSAVTDHQCKITIPWESGMQYDFADLRFTSSDGTTLLYHWKDKVLPAVSAVVTVLVTFSGGATEDVYVYFGNDEADAADDGDNTFEYFDAFDSGAATDNYETNVGAPTVWTFKNAAARVPGAYFDAGAAIPEDGTRGAVSTEHPFTDPKAWYDATSDKTYYVIIGAFADIVPGSANSVYVASYDHATGAIAERVKVFDVTGTDTHRAPSLFMASDGHIYVTGGMLDGAGAAAGIYRTNAARNISAWSKVEDPFTGMLYSTMTEPTAGTLMIFYARAVGSPRQQDWYFRTSTDDGVTWGAETQLTNFTGSPNEWPYPYIFVDSTGRIHVTWTAYDSSALNTSDGFYMYSDDVGANWKKSDGSAQTIPATRANSDKIIDSGSDRMWFCDGCRLSTGEVLNLYLRGTNAGGYTISLAKLESGTWAFNSVAAAANHQRNYGCMVKHADDNIRVYAPTDNTQGAGCMGGIVTEFISTDGGDSWVESDDVAVGDSNWSYVFPKKVVNAKSDGRFDIMLSRGDSRVTQATDETQVYAWGRSSVLFQLTDYAPLFWMTKTTSAYGNVRHKTLTTPTDLLVECEFLSGGANRQNSVLASRSNTGGPNNYLVRPHHSAASTVQRTVAAAITTLGSGATVANDEWHTIGLRVVGFTVTGYRDRIQLATGTDGTSAFATGRIVELSMFASNLAVRNLRVSKAVATEPSAGALGDTETLSSRSSMYRFMDFIFDEEEDFSLA